MAVPSAILHYRKFVMTTAGQKVSLRWEALARRVQLRASLADADERMAANFIEAIPLPKDSIVSVYAAIGDEADPKPLIDALRARGHAVLLPRVQGKGRPLAFHLYQAGGQLNRAPFGLSEPPADWPEAIPNILIVPLLAFDRVGHRLGYGAGFYDRTLEGLRAAHKVLAVGYGFAGQEIDHVPHHDGDQRLDWVVTETAARKF